MIEVVLGLLCAVLGVALFMAGYFFARLQETPAQVVPAEEEADEADQKKLRQIQEDQAAFAALMGYNADTAYGVTKLEFGGDK